MELLVKNKIKLEENFRWLIEQHGEEALPRAGVSVRQK
jgi:hypothetical protein